MAVDLPLGVHTRDEEPLHVARPGERQLRERGAPVVAPKRDGPRRWSRRARQIHPTHERGGVLESLEEEPLRGREELIGVSAVLRAEHTRLDRWTIRDERRHDQSKHGRPRRVIVQVDDVQACEALDLVYRTTVGAEPLEPRVGADVNPTRGVERERRIELPAVPEGVLTHPAERRAGVSAHEEAERVAQDDRLRRAPRTREDVLRCRIATIGVRGGVRSERGGDAGQGEEVA
jgi:predicted nuclease with RNAse H fold